MKPVYTLAIAFATLLSLNQASAQTYTAVRTGFDWHTPSGPNAWDPNGEPPANCNNCLITINSGVIVTLNTSVTLGGNSLLIIGTGGGQQAKLIIPASTGTDFTSSNNLILNNDGSTPGSQIQLVGPGTLAVLDGTTAGEYDGVLVAYSNVPVTYFKLIGTAPELFVGSTAEGLGAANFGPSLSGSMTLTSSGTLPIILTEFAATLDKSHVELDWATAMEMNSDHFAVQRLDPDNSTWATIGTVKAQGNSSLTVQYSFTDDNPYAGRPNEYRIMSVDRDGKYAVSTIQVVTLGAIDARIFPNPTSDYVNVNLSSTATGTQSIRLISQSGQLLLEKKVDNAEGTIVSLPVFNYPQGNYLIIVTGADGSRQVSKLFISHL